MSNRELRSRREIRKMRAAGLLVWQAHQAAFRILRPGITTREVNEVYRNTFASAGAQPLFLNYGEPPFPAETCISVNEEIVHGIPGERVLREGDIVSLDTGCRLDGWCGDAAVTHAIGEVSDECQRLMNATNRVLNLAIELMDRHTVWSAVAKEMEAFIHDQGFSVVEEMVGHGIGRELHEPPQVPNYLAKDLLEEDFDLRPGVVLAVEPMINAGVKELRYLADEWTVVTMDGKPSAHFEHTIAITAEGPWRLTGPPSEEELELVPEEFRDPAEWVNW